MIVEVTPLNRLVVYENSAW